MARFGFGVGLGVGLADGLLIERGADFAFGVRLAPLFRAGAFRTAALRAAPLLAMGRFTAGRFAMMSSLSRPLT